MAKAKWNGDVNRAELRDGDLVRVATVAYDNKGKVGTIHFEDGCATFSAYDGSGGQGIGPSEVEWLANRPRCPECGRAYD